jgi:3-(3-hydroxy-phenyl)propionate hydroxylase
MAAQLMSSQLNDTSYDVAIIGYGPSGAVAAALMGKAGIKALVIDQVHEVFEKPRAIALDHEIMRAFQHIGVVEDVLPWTEPFTPSEYYGVDQQLIKRLATVEPPYPLGYNPSIVFTQPPVERLLRKHVGALDSVTVALGHALVALEQDADQVYLKIKDRDGRIDNVTAKYVIGCDGAWSTVRNAVGLELEDLQFDEPWLVVDVQVNEQGLAKLPKTSVQYCEPTRPCTYVIGPKNHRRWEISLLPGEDPKYMATEEGAWSVLKRWITPDDATLWRQASYRFHALVAREWRKGRVFIAGDAAHQQPPFLGQGMCQGVRDVVNLSWKLQAMLEGKGSEELLDSYGIERGQHVRALTAQIKHIGSVICERDTDLARARDAKLLQDAGGQVKTQARQDIIPPLQAGLLAADAHSARGTLFPQPRVISEDGSRLLDDITGCGWRVVTSLPLAAFSPTFKQKAATIGRFVSLAPQDPVEEANGPLALAEVDKVMQKWFERHGCAVALVRPDHYVFGAAQTPDALEAMLDDATARAGLHASPRAEAELAATA